MTALLGFGPALAGPPGKPAPVSIQLKWRHQFQFAGYYAAERMGYFAAEGLEAKLLEGGPGRDPVREVATGRADYGVGDSDLLVARGRGLPVVAVASIFQHSPYVLMTRRADGLKAPADLVGRRVMVESDQGETQTRAMFLRAGIDPRTVIFLHHSWNPWDLVEGRTDAMSAYASVEPFLVEQAGTPVSLIRPSEHGIDFYGDCLFTSSAEADSHPDRVAAVRRAVLRGWDYALQHPGEVGGWIETMPGVKARGITAGHLLSEAEAMKPLVLTDIVPLGHMNRDRWERILKTYQDLGILGPQANLQGFLFEPGQLLPDRLRRQLVLWVGVSIAALLLFLAWTFTLRRRIREGTRALKESEDRFKQLVETSPDPIFIESEGRFDYLNPAALELFGFQAPEELLGRPVLELVHSEDRARIESRVEAFQRGPAPLERTELRVARPDGRVVEVEVTTTPIPWKGRTAGRVFLRDITARNAAWKDREESEENFRQLVDGSQDCIFVSSHGRFRYMNPAGLRLFQVDTQDQIVGLPMMEFIHPEDAALMLERSRIFHETGEPAPPQELRVVGRQGRVTLVEVTTTRIEFQGEVAARVFMRDVSARRAAEADLRFSQGILQGFFDGAPFQMGVTELTEDLDVVLLSLNPSAAAAMGLSTEAATGMRISELGLPGAHRGVWVDQYQEALRTRTPVHFDTRMPVEGGEQAWAITLAWIGEGPSGRPRFAYVVQDVTAQRRMARELEEREATLRAFYDGAPMLMGVTEVTPEGEMIAVSVNEAMARTFGRRAQDTAGLTARQAGMTEETHALWLARYREAGTAGRPIHFVLDSFGMGLKGWLSVTIAPIGQSDSGNPRFSFICEDISESVRDREALVASESRLEEAQRIAHLGSWVWDGANDTMTWSDELCRIFGVDPVLHAPSMEDAIGRVHPDDQALAQSLVGGGPEGLKPFSLEFRILRPDGEVRTILNQGEVLLDARGRATGLAGACLDITERKRAEQTQAALHRISEAAQSTSSLTGLFQSIHAIISDLLPARNFFVALYEEASDELTFPYFVDERDAPPGPRKLGDGTLSGQVIRRGESLLLTRETQALRTPEERSVVGSDSLDWLGVPLKSHERTIGVLVVQSYTGEVRYTDKDRALLEFVSSQVASAIERKHAEQELRDQNDLHRMVQRATNDVIWVWDLVNHTTSRSDTIEAMFGYSLEEALPTEAWWEEHLHPEDRERVRQGLDAVLREGGSAWSDEYRFRRKDGVYAKVLDRGYVVRDGDGRATRMVGAISDLTLRIRAEEALAANQAKSAFLATMSHEIRTPMIGMLGMVEILSHTRLDDEQRSALGVVQSSARALLGVIGDILDFSKIEAGRLELEPQVVSLRRVVEEEFALSRGTAAAKGLGMTLDLDPRLRAAHLADPIRFRQILANFYSNALKFTARGSLHLSVEVLDSSEESQTVAVRLRDTGIGVSPENQKRLFQPFMQAESSTTRRFGGSGLGLSICLRLAELMGGRITMESVEGEGTTMSFVAPFPLADPADLDNLAKVAAWDPMEAPPREGALAAGCLLLLAEDHPTNQVVLLRQLRMAGYQADLAEDGRKALEAWGRCPYGLVLTDIHMPVMDGYQLAAAIREAEAAEGRTRIPILALTANALRGELERCLAVGMDDCIIKPVSIPDLDAKLRHWLPGAIGLAKPKPADAGAGTPAPVSRTLPVDLSILENLSPGDRQGGLEILQDFRDTTRADLALLREAAGQGQRPQVARLAHRIKGAAGLIGARPLAEAAGALEAEAGSKDGGPVASLAAVEAAFTRLDQFATAELERR